MGIMLSNARSGRKRDSHSHRDRRRNTVPLHIGPNWNCKRESRNWDSLIHGVDYFRETIRSGYPLRRVTQLATLRAYWLGRAWLPGSRNGRASMIPNRNHPCEKPRFETLPAPQTWAQEVFRWLADGAGQDDQNSRLKPGESGRGVCKRIVVRGGVARVARNQHGIALGRFPGRHGPSRAD